MLNAGKDRLQQAGVPEPATDSELIWEYVSGMDKLHILLNKEQEVDAETERHFRELIDIRSTRKPLQYITGVQNFMGMDFSVSENVLIPRQDTEILAEQVLSVLHLIGKNRIPSLLDLCCGSGCVGLAVRAIWKHVNVTLSDISEDAVALAKKNANQLHVDCDIIKGDLFENITERYDMIVSNPPYIESQTIEELMPEVRDFEPRLALDGASDGLAYYRRIVRESENYIKNEGYLFFEIGNHQAYDVQQLLVDAQYEDIHVVKDFSGNDRVIYGKRKPDVIS